MKKNRCFLAALLAASSLLFTGCLAALVVGAAAGAGAVAYKNGKLVATESTTMDKAWDACLKAFKDLDLLAEAKEQDELASSMEAQGAGDKRIIVKLKSKGDKLIEISIRVGIFGDESYSRQILDKIKSHL